MERTKCSSMPLLADAQTLFRGINKYRLILINLLLFRRRRSHRRCRDVFLNNRGDVFLVVSLVGPLGEFFASNRKSILVKFCFVIKEAFAAVV